MNVAVLGGTADFVDGEFLYIKEERYPDGSKRRTYWEPTEQVLWLYGDETYSPDGERMGKTVYDPPVRYLGRADQVGFGWGTTTTVAGFNERGQTRSALLLFEFKIIASGDPSVPAGRFDGYGIRVTATPTDTRDPTGPTEFVNEFWFQPGIGILRDQRADGRALELVDYSVP